MLNISHKLKKINAVTKPYNNEKGFIMAAVMLLSLMLLIIVTIAIWSSTNEAQIVRNTGLMTQEFYDAESGIVGAVNNSSAWLTNDFLNAIDPDNAYLRLHVYSEGSVEIIGGRVDGSTVPPSGTHNPSEKLIAEVQIRHINTYADKPVVITDSNIWKETNEFLPNMTGNVIPIGEDASKWDARSFTLTAKDFTNNNATIQIGLQRMVLRAP